MKNLIFNPAQTIKKGLPASAKSAVKGVVNIGSGLSWKAKPGVFFNLWTKTKHPVKPVSKSHRPIVIPVNQAAAPLSGNEQKNVNGSKNVAQVMASNNVPEQAEKKLANASNVADSEPLKKVKLLETELSWPAAADTNFFAQFQNNLSPIVNKLIQAALNASDVQNQLALSSAKIVKVNFIAAQKESSLSVLTNQKTGSQLKCSSTSAGSMISQTMDRKAESSTQVRTCSEHQTLKTSQLTKQSGTVYLKNLTGLMWQPIEQEQEVQKILQQINLKQAPELNVRIQAVLENDQTNLFKISIEPVKQIVSQPEVVQSNQPNQTNQTIEQAGTQGLPKPATSEISLKANLAANTAEQMAFQKESNKPQVNQLIKTKKAFVLTEHSKTTDPVHPGQQPGVDHVLGKTLTQKESQQPLNLILKVETEEKVQQQTSSEILPNFQKTSNQPEGTQETAVENKSDTKLLKIQIHQIAHSSNNTLQNMEFVHRYGTKNVSSMDQLIARVQELVDQVRSTKLHNGSIRMSLDDTPMGKIDLKFQQHDRQLIVVVENEQIRNELIKLTPVIQQNLADKGITLNSFQVNVGQFAQSDQQKQLTSKKRGQMLNPFNSGKEVGHHESQSTLANRKFGYNTMEITV